MNPYNKLISAARRGAVHIAVGLTIALGIYYLPEAWLRLILSTVTFLFVLLEYIRYRTSVFHTVINRVFHPFIRTTEEKSLSGASFLLLGCLITVLLFDREYAFTAVCFFSLGDPLATIYGTWRGKHRVWGKSLEGHLACLAVCIGTAYFIATVLTTLPLSVVLIGALAAAAFEMLPLPINDNITIPAGSGLFMLLAGLVF